MVPAEEPPDGDLGRRLRRSEPQDDHRRHDPRRARGGAPRIDHHLSHQRPRLEDARGAAGHPERAARAGVPVRAALRADARPAAPPRGRPPSSAGERPRRRRPRPRSPRHGPLRPPDRPRWPAPRRPGSRPSSPGAGSATARTRSAGTWPARPGRGAVWIARATPRGAPLAIAVVDDGVLLGSFVALLAVRPEASGQGLGRALVDHVAARTFATRRWLYVSVRREESGRAAFLPQVGLLARRPAPRSRPPRARRDPARDCGNPRRQRARVAPAKIPTGVRRVGYHQGAS